MNADLLGTHVKVTTIAPGAVQTNFSTIRFGGDTKKADAVYDGYTPLTAEDISSVIINVLNTPQHVNIQYLDIMPTAQRNPYLIHRKLIVTKYVQFIAIDRKGVWIEILHSWRFSKSKGRFVAVCSGEFMAGAT